MRLADSALPERKGAARGDAGTVAVPLPFAPQYLALAVLLAATAVLNFWQIDRLGYGNTYYAAAIKSMLQSWHNFFFVSFDPGGFVSIDKPPLAFWLQALSARVFGFSGFSILLPQILAGVLSVAALYYLVERTFGAPTALLAALFLATTPIAVAINRDNSIDSVLVLVLLLAAWAVLRAVERGSLRWLLLCAVLLGLGFNIKMLQAFLVLPACGALYLFAAPLPWSRRLYHLMLATVMLLAVSFAWIAVVDSTPASQRPFVGSSCNNSELNLAVGANGLGRLVGVSQVRAGCDTSGAQSGLPGDVGPGFNETGSAGPLRLINVELGGQVGWLLPLALLGSVFGAWRRRSLLPLDRRQQAALLWGGWLLTTVIFFSFAGFFHVYYLVMLAPPVAVLAAIALTALWQVRTVPGWQGWVSAPVVLGAAAMEAFILRSYPDWNRWLTPLILLGAATAALLLILTRWRPHLDRRWAPTGMALAVLALVTTPAIWSVETVSSSNVLIPRGGPATASAGGFGAVNVGDVLSSAGNVDPKLLRYLQQHRGRATYLLATANAFSAAPYILATGEPVMSVGGFSGGDQLLTAGQLAGLVHRGTVRYFLLMGVGSPLGGLLPSILKDLPPQMQETMMGARAGASGGLFGNAATGWVSTHCSTVSPSQYGEMAAPRGLPDLSDPPGTGTAAPPSAAPGGSRPAGGAPGAASPPAAGSAANGAPPFDGTGGLPGGGAAGFGMSTQLYDCATLRG